MKTAQDPDHGRVLRLAARDQARARRARREARLPAGGSRRDQHRRRARAHAGQGPRRPRRGRTRGSCPASFPPTAPSAVNPSDYDLVALAMQEPQYRSPGVRELLDAVAKASVPCMSIMNMPPLPYLARIPGARRQRASRRCYTDATRVGRASIRSCMTLCSPDPQAFRPPEEKVNVLQVRLPTNFKSARFESDAHTAMLRSSRPTSRPRASTRATARSSCR